MAENRFVSSNAGSLRSVPMSEGGDIMTGLRAGQPRNDGSNPGLRKRFVLSRSVQTGQPPIH